MVIKKVLLLGAVVLWGAAIPGAVMATLGERGDSVAADGRSLAGQHRRTVEKPGYTVREIESDAVTVREYVSRSDVVFGIAWNGIAPPDIDQLLGSYGQEYRQSERQAERRPGARNGSRVTTDRVVVETWGHMRNLQGRAYAPALVPKGVTVDEIR